MKVGKELATHFMTLTHEFHGIRLVDRVLFPCHWLMTVDMTSVQYNDKFDLQKSNEAYSKLLYWLEYATSYAICVDATDEESLDMALSVDNIMIFFPGEPDDCLMAEMFHAKITSILGDDLYVGDISIACEGSPASYTFSPQQSGYVLPKKTDAFMPDMVLHQTPWWFRNDGFVSEFFKIDDEEECRKLEEQLEENDPLNHFKEILKEQNAPKKEPAKIIEVEKWRPKKV